MKPIIVIMCLLLSGCFGAELFKLGGIGIKTGDVITVPHKIETIKECYLECEDCGEYTCEGNGECIDCGSEKLKEILEVNV